MTDPEISPDPFVSFLRSRKGSRVYLKPYRGNSGDDLISLGCSFLLEREGLNRTFHPHSADMILWPGGNPTMWKSNLEEWAYCWSKWPEKEFVVGPATFQGDDLPWRSLIENTRANLSALFARDPASYQNLKSLKLPNGARCGLSHDPALMLWDSHWAEEHRKGCSREHVLAAFRSDHEGIRVQGGSNRIMAPWPISSFFIRHRAKKARQAIDALTSMIEKHADGEPVFFEDVALRSFDSFVEKVSQASVVHTDRLHTMILGVLLGKKVVAYPTAYSKLEQVYEHSIKQRAIVQFMPLAKGSPIL
jgi:exopolysaccharide biosynthesis predicted pyruvyltransferase EpsI